MRSSPRRRARAPWLLSCLALSVWTLASFGCAEQRSLLVATTTSLHDSGLLAELTPIFRERTGIQVRIVAVGSGAALRMGADGNADLLLTHAPGGERKLVEQGAVLGRRPFMRNHFVIVGPPEDPAGVGQAPDARDAYRRMARTQAVYVSRGDDSGTHRAERRILESAGLDTRAPWAAVLSTGTGMGPTLQVAGEKRAYTLSDLGTFLAFRDRIDLVALSRQEEILRNEYAILRVSPERFPRVAPQADEALELETFLLSPEIQQRIAAFGRDRFGRSLFLALEGAGPKSGSS